jgi:hypothetical protein
MDINDEIMIELPMQDEAAAADQEQRMMLLTALLLRYQVSVMHQWLMTSHLTTKVLLPNFLKCRLNLRHSSPCIKKFATEIFIIVFIRI